MIGGESEGFKSGYDNVFACFFCFRVPANWVLCDVR